MSEYPYAAYPELYDGVHSDWEYHRDSSFVVDALAEHGVAGRRLLEVGCGTGERTRRFVAAGFDVTAVDEREGLLAAARTKCDADFRRAALPELAVAGEYDAITAMGGVLNRLPRSDLSAALGALDARLADGGLLVCDNAPLPPEGDHPALDVGTTERGAYARITQHVPTGDGRLDRREVLFAPDGEFAIDSRELTPFDDETIAAGLADLGFAVHARDGSGPDDRRTAFVAVA